MSALKMILCSATVFTMIGCVTAKATPLTYTVDFTENDGNGDSTGIAQFTIDSSLFSGGPNDFNTNPYGSSYTVGDVITAFSATFYNVGAAGITDTFGLSDVADVEIMVDPTNSPPIDWAFFTTNDNYTDVNSTFQPGTVDYLFGNSDIPGQTMVNDTSDLSISYSESISGSDAPPLPEPASLTLLGVGAACATFVRRRRRR